MIRFAAMGFFTKADPIAALKQQVEAKPKDTKLLLDLAGMLKAKGAVDESAEIYMRAAHALMELGFAPKAVAIAKQVTHMTPKMIEPFEFLAGQYEENKVKEELRLVLKTLQSLYRNDGKESKARETEKRLEALGPGR